MALAVAFTAPSNAATGSDQSQTLIHKPETSIGEKDLAFSPINFEAVGKTEAMTVAQATTTKCCSSGTCDIWGGGADYFCTIMHWDPLCN
jgi:hypothetical protein